MGQKLEIKKIFFLGIVMLVVFFVLGIKYEVRAQQFGIPSPLQCEQTFGCPQHVLTLKPEKKEKPFVPPELQIPIPGFPGFTVEERKIKICLVCKDPDLDPSICPPEQCARWVYQIPWIGEYILAIYKWGVGAVALLAVIMIMINGLRWIIARGEAPKISEAKKGITYAVTGLIFILLTHQILSLIDPRLTVFKPIVIGIIEKGELEIGEEDDPRVKGTIYCVPKEDIVGIEVDVWDIQGQPKKRYLQVHKDIVDEVKGIFETIYRDGSRPRIVEIGGFRGLSGKFDCRNSKHAKGLAIDINPDQNFMFRFEGGGHNIVDGEGKIVHRDAKIVYDGFWKPNNLERSKWRIPEKKLNREASDLSLSPEGIIVRTFLAKGWCWGGNWKKSKDYMHFSKVLPQPGLDHNECR